MRRINLPQLDPARVRRIGPIALAAATVLVVTLPAGESAASFQDGLECMTAATNSFSLTAGGRLRHHAGRQLHLHLGLRRSPAGRSSSLVRHCAWSPARKVTVVLHNTLPEATSIMFPGQSRAGRRQAGHSRSSTTAGNLTSLVQAAAGEHRVGHLHVHRRAPGHLPLLIRHRRQKQQPDGPLRRLSSGRRCRRNQVNDRADSPFNPEHEYLYLLSEIDPDVHLAVERKRAFDWTTYSARYFMINGRSMPDTIAPNHAAWLPSQPYGAPSTSSRTTRHQPEPALIRYLNAGP